MIYRFQSKAAGDVLMRGADGDSVLTAMGMAPAAQGIIEPLALAAALGAVEAAIAQSEVTPPTGRAADTDGPGIDDPSEPVSLRQRAWPLMDMMRRALDAGEAVVWGV